MSATIRAKTVVHFDNEDIQFDISAPGHYDELAAMQDAAYAALMWLHNVLPSLATMAIPAVVKKEILSEMVVKACATESASESVEDSSRASSNEE